MKTCPVVAVASCAVLLLSSCTTVWEDPEYKAKMAQTRNDWRGDEIVGVWVSKLNTPYGPIQTTVVNRPDGTHRSRSIMPGIGLTSGTQNEWAGNWSYLGRGSWQGYNAKPINTTAAGRRMTSTSTVRFTGTEQVAESVLTDWARQGHKTVVRAIFFKATDSAAVAEHMSRR